MTNPIYLHTLAYCAIFASYLIVSLVGYPRLWLRHYPAAVRSKQAPLSSRERLLVIANALVFVGGIVLGLPVLSVLLAYGSEVDPDTVFRHIATLGISASAVDWLILDWLLIRTWQPKWIVPADTDPADWRQPADFLRDAVGFLIGSLIALGWAYLMAGVFG